MRTLLAMASCLAFGLPAAQAQPKLDPPEKTPEQIIDGFKEQVAKARKAAGDTPKDRVALELERADLLLTVLQTQFAEVTTGRAVLTALAPTAHRLTGSLAVLLPRVEDQIVTAGLCLDFARVVEERAKSLLDAGVGRPVDLTEAKLARVEMQIYLARLRESLKPKK